MGFVVAIVSSATGGSLPRQAISGRHKTRINNTVFN
jgi:hypothetical protein